ncbi:hypothetical protein ABZ027_40865 [Streptomyces sp. NPDC006332]|uniref:hypothetical protein n=1 Tax=Streptomyces sp. NPDC006332 TaxID=3155456 RepID=UPI0033A4315F
MRRFKKVMLVTAAIGGIGLTGAGAAQAHGAGGDSPDATIDNAQLLKCEQEFTSSLVTVPVTVSVLGDSVTNIGNFCTQVGPRQ